MLYYCLYYISKLLHNFNVYYQLRSLKLALVIYVIIYIIIYLIIVSFTWSCYVESFNICRYFLAIVMHKDTKEVFWKSIYLVLNIIVKL